MTKKRFTFGYIDGVKVLKDDGEVISDKQALTLLNSLIERNKELNSELLRYKELNKLDVLKASYSTEDVLITKLQSKCDKKQEHIVVLENKIRRMREAIHKLEWLASHRNADLIRENEQLKEEYQRLRHNHSLLHDICLNAEHERDSLKKDVESLEKENEWLKQEMENLGAVHAGEIDKIEDELLTEIRRLEELNKELQQRNDRQADTIRELHNLIGNKNWKSLIEYMEELNKIEEQLQREWRYYSD